MSNFRIIARLDIKGANLIKGVHLEGLRVIGSPAEHALRYYHQGADELIYIDCVATLYGRNHLSDIIENTARNIFIPLTVGGGIRSVEDARQLLRSGADKIAINTAAVANPTLITEIAQCFGRQCMVLSVQALQTAPSRWEARTDNGREKTGLDVVDWIKRAVSLGAGEVLLTSIDREGTRKGFDLGLIQAVTSAVDVPVIASGGLGKAEDAVDAARYGADAIAIADMLHYNRSTVGELRNHCCAQNLKVRYVV